MSRNSRSLRVNRGSVAEVGGESSKRPESSQGVFFLQPMESALPPQRRVSLSLTAPRRRRTMAASSHE